MNQLIETWTEVEKQIYLTALYFILNMGDVNNSARKEFMKLKAQEVKVPLAKIKKIKKIDSLIELLRSIDNIKTKRFIIRDMILLALSDHDLSDGEMKAIYEISAQIGIKSEKIDDFFLWAAKGIEWQIAGVRLIDEDI